MAREDLTPEKITQFGIVVAETAPTADGDAIPAGRVYVQATNIGASAQNVVVQTPITVDGLDVEELTIPVGVGETVKAGPFPIRTFGQATGANETGSDDQGKVYIGYSAPADFTRAVYTIA